MANRWSDNLTQETRQAINDCAVTPQGVLHMKSINGSYGIIRLENLVSARFLVEDKKNESEYLFGSVDELSEAGWAID